MNQPKKPINDNYRPHGYWMDYHFNDILWYEGLYVNGKESGVWKRYNYDGNITLKVYYI
jgi:antitoxin component YwqK of YwqJK toxin-antitoxin module